MSAWAFEISVLNWSTDRTPKAMFWSGVNGVERQLQVLDRQMLLLESMGMSNAEVGLEMEVLAPMPGKVLSVEVSENETVEEGQALLVLEAMKMENVIRAPRAGVIASIGIEAGVAVEKGMALVTYEMEP